jgi:hypothetical protein
MACLVLSRSSPVGSKRTELLRLVRRQWLLRARADMVPVEVTKPGGAGSASAKISVLFANAA